MSKINYNDIVKVYQKITNENINILNNMTALDVAISVCRDMIKHTHFRAYNSKLQVNDRVVIEKFINNMEKINLKLKG